MNDPLEQYLAGLSNDQMIELLKAIRARKRIELTPTDTKITLKDPRESIKKGISGGSLIINFAGDVVRLTGGSRPEWIGPVSKLLGFINSEIL